MSDRSFLPWCATTALSCARATVDAQVRLHVLVSDDVSAVDADRLAETVAFAGNVDVDIEPIDDALISDFPSKGDAQGGRISWVRAVLPLALPGIDRVIYLDSDTLVRHSLLPLWNALGDAPLAAVANVTEPARYEHLHSLGFDDPRDYFNAGVLVMDLAAWRSESVVDQVADVASHRPLPWFDQDALNVVFAGRWARLHPRWNVMNSLWWWPEHATTVFTAEEVDAAKQDPAVVHFEGPAAVKPWHHVNQHRFRDEYRRTLSQTAWPHQPVEGRTLVTRLISRLPADRRMPAYFAWERFWDRAGRAPAGVRRRATNLGARLNAKRRNPNVSTAVSPHENMLYEGTLRLYFETGEDAFEQILVGLEASGVGEPKRVLDCPSGYGRVLRYMRAAWPGAQLVAMELRPGAAEFCAVTFGARPVQSANPLWSVAGAGNNFDLLWSGSLLTHFDSDAWAPTLAYFRDRVRVGGVLIFTTHGERSIALLEREPATIEIVRAACRGWTGDYGVADAARMVRAARGSGFAFTGYPGSRDWGISVSTPAWVRRTVEAVGGLEFVHHEPHGWSEHQDVWTFKRS